jgi:Flp pilus assembly pilin Flp
VIEHLVRIQVLIYERVRRIREEGATAVEYALMLGLMFLALLVGATNFSRTVNRSYNSITDSIASAVG